MLDVLATANWERPIYVNNTSLAQFNIDLTPFVVQEGNAYRILPVVNPDPNVELVNTEVAFENMTKKFQYRGLDDSTVYYTQDYRSFVQNHRSSLNSLAEALIAEGDKAKAREVLLTSLNKMPDHGIRYDFTNARMVELLLEVGEKEKAIEIVNTMTPRLDEMSGYYISRGEYGRELQINLYMLGELQRVLYAFGEADLAKKIEDAYTKHGEAFQNRGGFNR
jgi:tetratricopeptide (TPR) repeat protein